MTSHFTAHATDSFITLRAADGTYEPLESQETKIVPVPHWRGAICYWGLATQEPDWSTLQWLRGRATNAKEHASPETFARALAADLTVHLRRRQFRSSLDRGIGMHFSAYEPVDGYWVPELFQIRNWDDESYSTVRDVVVVTRETFGTTKGVRERVEQDKDSVRRLEVHKALQEGAMLIFNNGDPMLFNPIAASVLSAMSELRRRGSLRDPTDVKTHLSLVRRPVEIASRLLSDLAPSNRRCVGGKTHDLAVAPTGEMKSTTGDAP